MNELMLALEAMIRRIVQEEIASTCTQPSTTNFGISLKGFVDANAAEFAAIVSQGALDQTWFDEAIKAEAAVAAEQAVANAPKVTGGIVFADNAAFYRAVVDAVMDDNSDRIGEWISDKAYESIRNMDFSCSVSVD
jgi:hypothetical protein